MPAADRPPVGGAEFMAAHVAKLKAQNPNNVVVGAGDSIGASPLISALFQDEPAVETLNRIGLEFNSVGNHEFDKGSAELLRLQNGGCKTGEPNSCKGSVAGTPVPLKAPGSSGCRPTSLPPRPASPCCRPMASRSSRASRWPSLA